MPLTIMVKGYLYLNTVLTVMSCCLFYACGSRANVKDIAFANPIHLQGAEIRIDQIIKPLFFHLSDRYLYVSADGADKVLYVYSLPELVFVDTLIHRGNGPGEVPFYAYFCDSSDRDVLYINGVRPGLIKKARETDNAELKFEKDIILKRADNFNNMFIENDSLLTYFEPTGLSINKYDIVNDIIIRSVQYDHDPEKGSYNFNFGIMSANSEHIAYAYRYKKQIDVYDAENLELKFSLRGGGGSSEPTPGSSSNRMYYYNVIAGENSIYAFTGSQSSDGSITGMQMEIFDYEGNSTKKYEFDHLIQRCVVDEKRGYIYGYIASEVDSFIRYKML